MQAITKVFSDIVKPYIDATDNGLIDNDFTNGAVNLLPLITYTNRQFGDATNGYITVNSNADGSFTLNGSRISTASVLLIPIIKDGKYLLTNNILKKGKSYKYSCCPPNSVSQHLLSQINYRDGSNNLVQFEEGGAGVTINIPIDATAGNCNIAVYHDADFTDVIIKPMITLADMPNSDYAHYVPYAMSNQELTSENQTLTNKTNTLSQGLADVENDLPLRALRTELSSIIQKTSDGCTVTNGIPRGGYFYLNNSLVRAKTNIQYGESFSVDINYEIVQSGGYNELNLEQGNINYVSEDNLPFLKSGFYYSMDSTLNKLPEGFGVLIVLKPAYDYAMLLYGASSNMMYARNAYISGNSVTWRGPWKQIAFNS